MNLSQKRLKKYLRVKTYVPYDDKGLLETIRNAKAAFYENEADDTLSHAEFLYLQSRYIKKRWWVMQGLLLLALWSMLQVTESSFYTQRFMGVAAPLFAVLLLPELWKNRSAGALAVESAAYYSLRQIYAARIFLFALIDMLLLCTFSAAAVLTEKILLSEMMIHFFLPYIVSCCICFRTLYSRKVDSEAFALVLCMVWCGVWIKFVLDEKIYTAVSFSVWCVMAFISALYLVYCICRGQQGCNEISAMNHDDA